MGTPNLGNQGLEEDTSSLKMICKRFGSEYKRLFVKTNKVNEESVHAYVSQDSVEAGALKKYYDISIIRVEVRNDVLTPTMMEGGNITHGYNPMYFELSQSFLKDVINVLSNPWTKFPNDGLLISVPCMKLRISQVVVFYIGQACKSIAIIKNKEGNFFFYFEQFDLIRTRYVSNLMSNLREALADGILPSTNRPWFGFTDMFDYQSAKEYENAEWEMRKIKMGWRLV